VQVSTSTCPGADPMLWLCDARHKGGGRKHTPSPGKARPPVRPSAPAPGSLTHGDATVNAPKPSKPPQTLSSRQPRPGKPPTITSTSTPTTPSTMHIYRFLTPLARDSSLPLSPLAHPSFPAPLHPLANPRPLVGLDTIFGMSPRLPKPLPLAPCRIAVAASRPSPALPRYPTWCLACCHFYHLQQAQ
jgi:hypothetical protein